jgi:RsiW-degrading membrane proteinase PrsW (M82 family)
MFKQGGRSRAGGVLALTLLALALTFALGLVADHLAGRLRSPQERARSLAYKGLYAEAERVYLDLARHRPASLPAVVELLDNHELLLLARGPLFDESEIDQLLVAPDLPPDIALLGRWWREVTRQDGSHVVGPLGGLEDRAAVLSAADAEPPVPWANHLLGREAERDERDEQAAERFAREATAFDDRREDAERACGRWIEDGDWDRLRAALARPQFARQVGAGVRMQEAVRRRNWGGAARWFFPSQYEGATLGVLALALVSGLAWFAICAQMGFVGERPRLRGPLYLAAFVLGIASTYVALAVAILEHGAFGLAEKGEAAVDLIYFVVGVGLREELSKALLLLPLVPIIARWGRRREALACGALVGLGFAAEENLGYFHMGLSTALSRFLTANFLHVSTTGLVAVAIDDYVRGREDRPGDLSRTLMLVIVAHGLYDFFLSSASVDRGSFLSMLVFVLLTRRFVDVLRGLPGREGPLLRLFCVGLAVVAGTSFVYASARVGPEHAALALLDGALGVIIVVYVFVRELGNV